MSKYIPLIVSFWYTEHVAPKTLCALRHSIAYELNFSFKSLDVLFVSSGGTYTSARHSRRNIMSAASGELYALPIAMAALSSCVPLTCFRTRSFRWATAPDWKNKVDVRLFLASHSLENIKSDMRTGRKRGTQNQEVFQLQCECALVFPSVYPGSLYLFPMVSLSV